MRSWLWSAALIAPLSLPAWATESAWEELRGLPIVTVTIEASEVFDAAGAAEEHFFYSWVNAIHVRTRESVIRRELLFAVGAPFEPLRVAESERNLRALGIFQDALIEARSLPDGVAVTVRTSDRWSLRVITDLAREGDIYRLRLGLENINFLGRGSLFGGTVVASNDVDALALFAGERRLFGSRWNAAYAYGSDALAVVNDAAVVRPFYSEFAHWSADLRYRSVRGERRVFYDAGGVDSLDLDERIAEGFGARHTHGDVRARLGLLYARRSVRREVRSEQAALGLAWGGLQRRFRRVRNVDRYDTHEDINAGWSLQIGAGADLQALGADHDRPMWRLDANAARFLGDTGLVGFELRHHGFARAGRIENGRVHAELYGFWQPEKRGTLAWSLGGAALLHELPYLRFNLGGDNRLRGYAARFDTGSRAVWCNLEQRFMSPWHVLFLGLGVAVFVDIGQAWDEGEPLRLQDTHVGAGAGLRIGNRKSGAGILRLDFAFGRGSFEVSLASASFFRAARNFEFPQPSPTR